MTKEARRALVAMLVAGSVLTAAVVGQNPVPMANAERIMAAVRAQAIRHEPAGFIDLAAYRAAGGYALLQQ